MWVFQWSKSSIWLAALKYSHHKHDDVIKWKLLPRYWPFVRGIHRSPVNSPYKGQWRGALMFSLICAWLNGWANNREAGDLGRHRGHYDVTAKLLCSCVAWRVLLWYVKYLCELCGEWCMNAGRACRWRINYLTFYNNLVLCIYYITHVFNPTATSTLKINNDAKFVVTGGTGSCRDNHRGHQWRQSWHYAKPRFSANVFITPRFVEPVKWIIIGSGNGMVPVWHSAIH